MRALVTWSSKRGGTEGIGRILGEALQAQGLEVTAASIEDVHGLDGFDAVLIGGALYANRWPLKLRRFVNRHLQRLRRIPVWFFSSGPLDDSADRVDIPPTAQVAVLAERVDVTFGGRLEPNAKGFPASAIAKAKSGDWRSPDRIRAWAVKLAADLPTATAGQPIDHPARSMSRLLAHAVVGWVLCAAAMAVLLSGVSLTAALIVHAIAAPLFFMAIARHYFSARGARGPLPTAIVWTGVVALLDLVVVAGFAQHSLAMFRSVLGTWLPFVMIFGATWVTGLVMSIMPPEPAHGDASPAPEPRTI